MPRTKKTPDKRPEDTKMIEHEIVSEIERSYIDYSMSVIAGRALPDVRDGMKPVHRRILYGMHHLGVTPDKPHKKSARIVGEVMGKYHAHGDCYDANTRIYMLDGSIKTIEELTDIGEEQWILAIDEETNKIVPAKAHDFRIGQYSNKLYHIHLSNGYTITVTGNHPFRLTNGEWVKAEDLKSNQVIDFIHLSTERDYITVNSPHPEQPRTKLHRLVAKYFGIDGEIIHHNDGDMHNNIPENLGGLTRAEHALHHEDYFKGLEIGRERMFHEDGEIRQRIKKKNSALIKYVNNNNAIIHAVNALKKLEERNLELTYENYESLRENTYNLVRIDTLINKGIVNDFDDFVKKYKNKYKFYEIDYQEEQKPEKEKVQHSFKYKPNMQMLSKIVRHYENSDYSHPVEINELKNSAGYNNFIKHFSDKHSYMEFRDSLIPIIVDIQIEYLDESIPMYDFTVDKYHNMLICGNENSTILVVGHNSSIYESMVRMSQDFSMRYPLVDGHGNFGSIDGDGAAAQRYTEARMSPFSREMIRDIDKNTVDFVPNYDGEEMEPVVLPSRIPNLLVNGSNGIAVGMATNIPPHNLGECINACCKMIDDPDCVLSDLMRSIKGPDFPTGGIIVGTDGIKDMYKTGTGKFKVRAKADIVQITKSRSQILVTEIPYQVNKAKLVEKIADLVKSKDIDGITDIRDESSREGMRIVIDIRRDADPQIVLNNLYAKTQMQVTFGAIMLTLVDGVPRTLGLKDILSEYLTFQGEVIKRRTEYDLEKAEARAHILEGLLIALDNIDEVIKTIRNSTDNAKQKLMKKFKLSDIQAQAILDMRLARLQKLEREKIQTEYKEILEKIAYYKDILSDYAKIMNVVKEELKEIKKEWADKRRTLIEKAEIEEFDEEDLIDIKESTILVTKENNLKKTFNKDIDNIITKTEEADSPVTGIIPAVSTDTLLFFTDIGKVYQYKVFDIPDSKSPKGKAIKELVPSITIRENIIAVINAKNFDKDRFAVFVMKSGTIKKISYDQLKSAKSVGMNAAVLKDNDEIVSVLDVGKKSDLFLVTKLGKCIRFSSNDANPMGRTAVGVRGMTLEEGDSVMFGGTLHKDTSAFIVSENGHMKKILEEDIKKQARGGKGVLMNPRVKLKNTGNMFAGIIAEPGDILEIKTATNSYIIKTDKAKNLQMIDKMNNMRGISEENKVTEFRKIYGFKEEV